MIEQPIEQPIVYQCGHTREQANAMTNMLDMFQRLTEHIFSHTEAVWWIAREHVSMEDMMREAWLELYGQERN